ncbi:MAG: NYN domain-containing protein [Desulfobacterales bacterium]|nr:NYN domain-containing protein [Desulfobacterales bacterium]
MSSPVGLGKASWPPLDYDPTGFFLLLIGISTMNRVSFLVDGFNLYHSARKAEGLLKTSTKWLDIKRLCASYLHLVGRVVKDQVCMESLYYFSALAYHIETNNPGVTKRHKAFIRCLEDSGIHVELSRFKEKIVRCGVPGCGKPFKKHEEKETDVAIAVKILEILIKDECDAAVIMTGDTDLAPAVRTAKRLFPAKKIIFAFPFARKNNELAKLAAGSFTIHKKQYAKHQFPDPYILSNGSLVPKPSSW